MKRLSMATAFSPPCVLLLGTGTTSAFISRPSLRRPPSTAPPHDARAARLPPTMSSKKRKVTTSLRVENRIARARYDFLETFECGIELLGTEIKSVRGGKMNIRQGYGRVKDGQLFLHNVHISHWELASKYFNHDPIRPRRLLLHKRSIRKLDAHQRDPGLTIVPTCAYLNKRGVLKVEIALARGKKLHDKREDMKRRDDKRTMERVVKAAISSG